jgi:2-polyprenyl-3-methyl-5-hydroxy-6-metoxy-1,4-benzoquinol methylase
MTDEKQHWEQVYASKPSLEVGWYQAEPRLSLELIQHSGIGKDAPLIDVGGGDSLLVDRLQAEGYRRLAVLDFSGTALAVARQRLGTHAADIEWYETDVTQFIAPHPFSLWHDRAVFHFLTVTEDRKRYVEVLKSTLVPGGHVIMATFAIGGPTRCSGLDIVQYDAPKLMAELGPDFQLEEQQTEIHLTPAGKEQLFGYFRLRKI